MQGPEREDNGPEVGTSRDRNEADRIGRIIAEAQQSAKRSIDEANHQSELILAEAREEAKVRRTEMLGRAQQRIQNLIETAEDALAGASQLSADLRRVTDDLREVSDHLRNQVTELTDEGSKRERRRSRR